MYLSVLGLVLDIVGAILLIKGEIQGNAALVDYWRTGEQRENYLKRLQGFSWCKRWMLDAAGYFGSREHLGQEALEESLPVKMWGIVFLIGGFFLQGLGLMFQCLPQQ